MGLAARPPRQESGNRPASPPICGDRLYRAAVAGHADDDLLSTDQVAELLGITPRTVINLGDNGALSYLVVGRARRYTLPAIDAFLDGTRVQVGALSHLRPPPVRPKRSRRTAPRQVAANAARAAQDEAIAARYLAGTSAEVIARQLGIRVGAVYRALQRQNVPRTHKRGHPTASFADRLTQAFLAEEYTQKERSTADIAAEVGCSESTIRNWLRYHGIRARNRTDRG
jgi:excisionase family DNA binding protein